MCEYKKTRGRNQMKLSRKVDFLKKSRLRCIFILNCRKVNKKFARHAWILTESVAFNVQNEHRINMLILKMDWIKKICKEKIENRYIYIYKTILFKPFESKPLVYTSTKLVFRTLSGSVSVLLSTVIYCSLSKHSNL